MDVSINQPEKHDSPTKTSEEQPKEKQKSENISTEIPTKTECNDDARQTLKDSGNEAVQLKTTPEVKEKPNSSPEANLSDVKGDSEPEPKAGERNASVKTTEGNGGPRKTSETLANGNLQPTQLVKVKEAPSGETASTGDQLALQQQPKSSEAEPQPDESRLEAGPEEASVKNGGEEPQSSDQRDGDLVIDPSKSTKPQSEEAVKTIQKENVSKSDGAEHSAKLQESPAGAKAEHELWSGTADQNGSSADKSVQQRSEDLGQTAPNSSRDKSNRTSSMSEKPKLENRERTDQKQNDPASKELTPSKPSQAKSPQETMTQEKASQGKQSQEIRAKEEPSLRGKPTENSLSHENVAQGLSSPEGKPTLENSAQKVQSHVKNDNDSPSQKTPHSQNPQEESSTQDASALGKSTEVKSSQQTKAVQQTETKTSQPDKSSQPQSTQGISDKTMDNQATSQIERKYVKQDPNQGSAQVQHRSATAKQTPTPQSIQQTQHRKTMSMKPVVQKQAPAAAQRLTRLPPAAAQQRVHQQTRVTVPGKTAAFVGKAIAKPAGASAQATQAPSQHLSNAQQSSRALQVARLVMNFLGPNHPPPQNPQLPTLNSLRTRLFADPNQYDSRADQLAWQTREAIRTEFFKVLYPAPPPNSLLTLVTATESIFAPFQPRPFFFPGARVAVPTEAGSRRAATSLQLRFKQVDRTTVAEALLHLDGPNGGGFQWVQAPALTPLSLYAPQAPRTVQKKTKRPRVQRPTKPRKKREKSLPPAPPVPPKPISKPTITPSSRPTPAPSAAITQAKPRAHTKTQTSALLKAQAPKPARTSLPAPTPTPPPPPIPAPRLAGVVARLARQEASGVYVPDALRGTSPPPRARIVGEGRFVSHVTGTMRSAAFDIDKILGVERLVARRVTDNVEYFVKWSGVPLREGSWESREALLKDVPGLVRDFDVRHPEKRHSLRARGSEVTRGDETGKKEAAQTENSKVKHEHDDSSEIAESQKLTRKGSVSGEIVTSPVDTKDGNKDREHGKKEGEDKKDKTSVKQYIDDVTGLPIPSWLDTPIVELNISGMVLQIRRPNEAVLHNDATSAVRDAKKRQTRFKQENILLGERLFPLTKPEAKSVIDAAAKDHRQHNRVPIPFPRGIGRVSPTDHGHPFSCEDVLRAPPSWEAYLIHIGMVPTDYTRSLLPHMPTLDEAGQAKLLRARDELAFSTACEHRERARLLLRESFRHTGAPPPEHIFRDGVRAPPGEHTPVSKKRLVEKTSEGKSRGLLRARDPVVESALKKARKLGKDKKGAWFDEVWACWRPAPS